MNTPTTIVDHSEYRIAKESRTRIDLLNLANFISVLMAIRLSSSANFVRICLCIQYVSGNNLGCILYIGSAYLFSVFFGICLNPFALSFSVFCLVGFIVFTTTCPCIFRVASTPIPTTSAQTFSAATISAIAMAVKWKCFQRFRCVASCAYF